jgi:hypothetical protein
MEDSTILSGIINLVKQRLQIHFHIRVLGYEWNSDNGK